MQVQIPSKGRRPKRMPPDKIAKEWCISHKDDDPEGFVDEIIPPKGVSILFSHDMTFTK